VIQCPANFFRYPRHHSNDCEEFIVLGDKNSKRQWVYLSGLTPTFDSPQEIINRKILDEIGHKLGIGFFAIRPKNRSSEFNNMLCWPHYSMKDVFSTYRTITKVLEQRPIAGWIGFSNGGFFLNRLVQYKELDVPVIAIGASGYLQISLKNRLYLMVGNSDPICELVKKLYQQTEGSLLTTTLIEYDGNHTIVRKPLQDLLQKL